MRCRRCLPPSGACVAGWMVDAVAACCLCAGALEKYCTRLSTTAVWGGQVEIQVLATVLKHPIHVYQAVGPVQKMGDFDTEPLRVR